MVDTSRIHSLIARARTRLKLQAALESATLAAVPGFATASVIWFAARMEWLSRDSALLALAAVAGAVLLAGVIGGLRRFPGHLVAQKIDRASNLSDRLGTACAFEAALATGGADDPDTHAMMAAAIRDAVTFAPRADVKAATPFRQPRDLPAAAAFGAVFLVLQLLFWVIPNDTRIFPTSGFVTIDGAALPDQEGHRGTLVFQRLDSETRLRVPLGNQGAFRFHEELERGTYAVTYVPNETLCDVDPRSRKTTMPCVAGPVAPSVHIGPDLHLKAPSYRIDCGADACTLELDIKRRLMKDGFDMGEDDLDYISDLLNDLRRTAADDKDPSLQEFVSKVDELLAKAEKGELTKEQLLDEMRKAEEAFKDGNDPHLEEALADLAKTGEELKKNQETKELGKALEKGDLEKAQAEMEKLADKLEQGKMSEKEKQKLAKALENAAEKFDKAQKKKDEKEDQAIAKQQKKVEKMQRQLDQEKDENKRAAMERRLEKEKRDLKKLERKKEERQASKAKRNLKELHRNMKQAAQNMQSKDQEQQKQASRKMRDMQRNTGKVDSDKRKVQTQKKVASQMDDLREAMRRAKRRGQRGPRDLFGKNRKKNDFGRRARGLSGQKGAWKPGQKGGKGMGQKPGGKGQKPGGKQWGDGHDPNLMDAPTGKSGDIKDQSVSGIHGKGPSQRETILSAAQKGFSSQSYKEVYARYKSIVEEVMLTEKVPSGYRNYIKRYFKNIKPHSMD